MRIHVLSDLHFEFQKWRNAIDVNEIEADVTVLAGDIAVGLEGIAWALKAFKRPAVYVMGNHEFYGQLPMKKLMDKARARCAGTHVHLLENESVVLDGVRFAGCTLWTDFAILGADRQEECMNDAKENRTDYSLIYCTRRGKRLSEPGFSTISTRRQGDVLTPKKVLAMHTESRDFLASTLATPFPGKTVVVTHHAPSAKSLACGVAVDPHDAGDASALDHLLPMCDLWIHGHTHLKRTGHPMSNPRGYRDTGPHSVADFDPRLVIEV